MTEADAVKAGYREARRNRRRPPSGRLPEGRFTGIQIGGGDGASPCRGQPVAWWRSLWRLVFASGLNVYATVATLGLLARTQAIDLPPVARPGHKLVGDWCECHALRHRNSVADKIPAIDLIWNALQTFVRIPVAALLAYAATARLSPVEQLLAATLGGCIALIAHGGKTAAVRVAVTPSPEPLSNIALSAGEDVLAVFISWLAGRHPDLGGGHSRVATDRHCCLGENRVAGDPGRVRRNGAPTRVG